MTVGMISSGDNMPLAVQSGVVQTEGVLWVGGPTGFSDAGCYAALGAGARSYVGLYNVR